MEQDTDLPPEAEKMLRLVHEAYTWQGGGDHPNTIDLEKCGSCLHLIDAYKEAHGGSNRGTASSD